MEMSIPKSVPKKQLSSIVQARPQVSLEATGKTVQAGLVSLANQLLTATPPEVTAVMVQLKTWTKAIKDISDVARALLIAHLQKEGKQTTEKGSLGLEVGGFKLEARPTRTGYDAQKVEALLRAKELSLDTYMDKDIRYVLNETRLESAVVAGVLSKDEVETCRYEVSYALQTPKKVSAE